MYEYDKIKDLYKLIYEGFKLGYLVVIIMKVGEKVGVFLDGGGNLGLWFVGV